jgi:hypothetical protein
MKTVSCDIFAVNAKLRLHFRSFAILWFYFAKKLRERKSVIFASNFIAFVVNKS